MPAHKHAALMMLYAQDATETDKPWERWEYRYEDSDWHTPADNLSFFTGNEYRRKQKTIRIGEYDVPEPVRKPLEPGQVYYYVTPTEGLECACVPWRKDALDKRLLKRGLIHLTKEAAELHAKALISFTANPSAGTSRTDNQDED